MEYTPHDIDAAVRRFWDGDTTLEEETALRNYFRFREVPEQYADLAAYFEMAGDDVAAPGPEFDERVLALTVNKPRPARGGLAVLRPLFRVASVAAVIAGVWFGVSFFGPAPSDLDGPVRQDTSLQQADPEVREAFNLLKEKLSFMSRKMDETAAHTGKLDKINTAVTGRRNNTVSQ